MGDTLKELKLADQGYSSELPGNMTETSGGTYIPAQLFTTANPTGSVGTSSQSTTDEEEIKTSRPQVAGARSVSTQMDRYPQGRNTSCLEDKLAYRKKTNVTTEEEGTHQQGWSDTPGINPTMTALSQLELELITSGTKKSIDKTNTEGDRVPMMTW